MGDSFRPSFKRLPSQTLGPSNAKRAFFGRGQGQELRDGSSAFGGGMGGMAMGMSGFEGSAVVDFDDGYNNAHPAAAGMVTGLSHPDRVVKSLAERRKRKRRMSAPTSGSGIAGLELGLVDRGGMEK